MKLIFRMTGVLGALLAANAVFAAQTVDPRLTPTGANIGGTTQTVPAGTSFTFYGMYSDDTGAAESGLGLKVKYDGTKLTNVTVTEEYTKCRIAVADVQNPTTATAQVVMGWIDTSIRPNGVLASATGAVGWPDAADLATGGCLNPGAINGAATAGDSAGTTTPTGASPVKLFRITGTMAPSCNTNACTSTITFDSEGNYSYANGASAGFNNKSFTIQGAAAPTIALAAANPFVSRKTHGAAGDFDIVIDPTGSSTPGQAVTIEPRQAQSGSHQIVVSFNSAVTAAEFPSANITAMAGATVLPQSIAYNGNSMTITVGNSTTPVPNGSRVTVGANGAGAAAGLNFSAVVGFLLGDVDATGGVNALDVNTVRTGIGALLTSANFKRDVDVSGGINALDVNTTRVRIGNTLP